ncbi:hypothetical protein Pcinc_040475, partial [Petrolisthes cinctipes]
ISDVECIIQTIDQQSSSGNNELGITDHRRGGGGGREERDQPEPYPSDLGAGCIMEVKWRQLAGRGGPQYNQG